MFKILFTGCQHLRSADHHLRYNINALLPLSYARIRYSRCKQIVAQSVHATEITIPASPPIGFS